MTPRAITQQLAADIAQAHGVTVQQLMSTSRLAEAVEARQALYAALRAIKWPNGDHRFSLPQIARLTGRKDHSTIIWGVRRHAERMGVAAHA
jgi:chromosomal replication initiation ATPase DnaA